MTNAELIGKVERGNGLEEVYINNIETLSL
jgi:hypothetical protein